jgi:mannose-6-phosphate isomerase-like protein (cupin superfamily)
VVTDIAEVTAGEKTFLLLENKPTYISLGTVHRLANPEVQCGTCLGDDGMVRFDKLWAHEEGLNSAAAKLY